MRTIESTKVLVIDDCPDNVLLLEILLKMEGYQVYSATNGRAGLRSAQKEIPDLIILDLMMPDLSGLEVIKNLDRDERLADIPTLLLTANTELNPRTALGANEICYKPFNIEGIVTKIKLMLSLKREKILSERPIH